MKKMVNTKEGIELVELTKEDQYVLDFAKESVDKAQRAYDYVRTHSIELQRNEGVVEQLEGEIDEEINGAFVPDLKEQLQAHVDEFVVREHLLGLGGLIKSLKRLMKAKNSLLQAQFNYNQTKESLRIVEDK